VAHVPAAERREQLVEAAIRVLSREGAARTTTRRIAQEAGIPVGILHYCFRDKDELLCLVIERITAELLVAGETALSPGADFADALRAGVRALWDVVVADVGKQMALYELTQLAMRTPGMEHVATRQYEGYLAAVTMYLGEAAQATGVTLGDDPSLLARWVVTTIDGVMLLYTVDRDADRAMAVLNAFVEALTSRITA
jgi:AcrR family transcriptional regulator